MSPALTVSPSRTRISMIRPAVFGETAESSPSMRPLTVTMLSGTFGFAKYPLQMKKAATPSATTISGNTFRRGRGEAGRAAGGAVGLVGAAVVFGAVSCSVIFLRYVFLF